MCTIVCTIDPQRHTNGRACGQALVSDIQLIKGLAQSVLMNALVR